MNLGACERSRRVQIGREGRRIGKGRGELTCIGAISVGSIMYESSIASGVEIVFADFE